MKRAAALILTVLVATGVFADTTAVIRGTVTRDGLPLAGTGVTAASGSMQGTLRTTTDVNGRYAFLAVPPGDYRVTFQLGGLLSSTMVHAGPGQTARVDSALPAGPVEGSSPAEVVAAAVETKGVQTNLLQSMVNELPVGRDPFATVALAPGTNGRVISGAPAQSSFWLLDGEPINDPAMRSAMAMFVEDATQETTLMTAAIPPEYGRFAGGIVNAITKSGGNELKGSFRDSFSNPAWTARSPYQNVANSNALSQTYEGTLGGRVIRDRLWFFLAGREFSNSIQQFYARSPSWGFLRKDLDRRWESKLTAQPFPGHSVAVSLLDSPTTNRNYCFVSCAEPSNVDASRAVPKRISNARYNGMLNERMVSEAFWSGTKVRFESSGGDTRDLVNGTVGIDAVNRIFFGAPVFCGVCDPETRTSTHYGVKTSWSLPTSFLGTHILAAGYDHWQSDQISNNYQSASDFRIYTYSRQTYGLRPGDVFKPVIAPGDEIVWTPIPVKDRPSNQQMHGVFVEDRWDPDSHWSFDLGIRYDLNDIVDESEARVSNTFALQPRLAAVWDARGDGRARINASYSQYADRITNTIGSAAWSGGSPMALYWMYDGPVVQGLPTSQAFAKVFQWFNAQCDPSGKCGKENFGALEWAGGGNNGVSFGNSLKAPRVDEATLGFSIAPNARGYLRVDAITRRWHDFISERITTETGQTTDLYGNPIDRMILENNDAGLSRRYKGVMVQGAQRFGARWNLGANYTWSKTTGNASPTGMSGNGGANVYPELTGFQQQNPVGYVPDDQRHKARAWLLYALPTRVGNLDLSVLQSFDSGRPYSLVTYISTAFAPDALKSYAQPPLDVPYFLSGRGALRWDSVTSTDVALRYEYPLVRTSGVFVDVNFSNIFNESARIGGDTAILARRSPSCKQKENPALRCALFNPFTEKPVEGVNYMKSPTFGRATSTAHYQTPRTYALSAGIRF